MHKGKERCHAYYMEFHIRKFLVGFVIVRVESDMTAGIYGSSVINNPKVIAEVCQHKCLSIFCDGIMTN